MKRGESKTALQVKRVYQKQDSLAGASQVSDDPDREMLKDRIRKALEQKKAESEFAADQS